MELNENGYQIELYEDILEEMNQAMLEAFPNLDLTDSNPLIVLNKKMADNFSRLSLMGAVVYNSFNIETATDQALDARVSFLGLRRREATESTGQVTITGDIGTVIDSGFLVSTEDDIQFETLNTVTIGDTGSVTVDIASVDVGFDTRVVQGAINTIVNYQNGVTSVTNELATTGGNDVETDTELRERYYIALRGIGKTTIISIKNAILNNTEATKVELIENDTDEYDAESGLPAHSFKVYVNGGDQDEILQQIYECRPAGITSVGSIEKQFDGIYWARFSRPVPKTLSVNISVNRNTLSTVANVDEIIRNNIIELVDSLNIHASISYDMLISAIYKNTGNAITGFTTFEFWIDELDKKGLGDTITLGVDEFFTTSSDNLNIEVV